MDSERCPGSWRPLCVSLVADTIPEITSTRISLCTHLVAFLSHRECQSKEMSIQLLEFRRKSSGAIGIIEVTGMEARDMEINFGFGFSGMTWLSTS